MMANERLRKAIERDPLTVAEVARELQCSRQWLYRVLARTSPPGRKLALRIEDRYSIHHDRWHESEQP